VEKHVYFTMLNWYATLKLRLTANVVKIAVLIVLPVVKRYDTTVSHITFRKRNRKRGHNRGLIGHFCPKVNPFLKFDENLA